MSTTSRFGIADPSILGLSSAQQLLRLAKYADLGVTMCRFDADWRNVCYPGAGGAGKTGLGADNRDWSMYDTLIQNLMSVSIHPMMVIDGKSVYASGTSLQPTNLTEWTTNFVTPLVQRYVVSSQYGECFDWEVWNEPNNAQFWTTPNAANYTALLKAGYNAIVAAQSNAAISSAGLTVGVAIDPVTFLSGMYTAGAKGYMDGVGWHPYCYNQLPDTDVSQGWYEMNTALTSARSVMTDNGEAEKQIYITEFGGPTSGTGNGSNNYTTTQQATAYTQAIADAKAASWIGDFYAFEYEDEGTSGSYQNFFGLVAHSSTSPGVGGTHKSAYAAVKTAIA